MLLQTWAQILTQSFQNLWVSIITFLPNLLVAIFIFGMGWLVGTGLGSVVAQLVGAARIDTALKNAGIEDAVTKAGYRLDSGAFLGALVKWFVIIVFLVASLDVLGLQQINEFLSQSLLPYIPQVIIAVAVLLIAAVVADIAQNFIKGAARAADVPSAGFLGSVAKWSIWIFAIMAALNHLQVAPAFVQTLFTGFVMGIALAFGLAFGFGGQRHAEELIGKVKEEISRRKA